MTLFTLVLSLWRFPPHVRLESLIFLSISMRKSQGLVQYVMLRGVPGSEEEVGSCCAGSVKPLVWGGSPAAGEGPMAKVGGLWTREIRGACLNADAEACEGGAPTNPDTPCLTPARVLLLSHPRTGRISTIPTTSDPLRMWRRSLSGNSSDPEELRKGMGGSGGARGSGPLAQVVGNSIDLRRPAARAKSGRASRVRAQPGFEASGVPSAQVVAVFRVGGDPKQSSSATSGSRRR